jgi:hypothetical protein
MFVRNYKGIKKYLIRITNTVWQWMHVDVQIVLVRCAGSGVPRGGGGFGVFKPPPKFRRFTKATRVAT